MENKRLQIELEDLLHLKKAERPNEAFWRTFDRQLHERLQAEIKTSPFLCLKNFVCLYLKRVLRLVPATAFTLIICFSCIVLFQHKEPSRWVAIQEQGVQVRLLRQVPLQMGQELEAIPFKKLIGGDQKMVAMNCRDRFSF